MAWHWPGFGMCHALGLGLAFLEKTQGPADPKVHLQFFPGSTGGHLPGQCQISMKMIPFGHDVLRQGPGPWMWAHNFNAKDIGPGKHLVWGNMGVPDCVTELQHVIDGHVVIHLRCKGIIRQAHPVELNKHLSMQVKFIRQ